MKSDIDIKTIQNNEQYYYFYTDINFYKNANADQIIETFENAINNKICNTTIPVFISLNNNITEYTWLDDSTKLNLNEIVQNEFNHLFTMNSYYANKKY
jgi:hypothetical protein